MEQGPLIGRRQQPRPGAQPEEQKGCTEKANGTLTVAKVPARGHADGEDDGLPPRDMEQQRANEIDESRPKKILVAYFHCRHPVARFFVSTTAMRVSL
jgi:hypothetical protein